MIRLGRKGKWVLFGGVSLLALVLLLIVAAVIVLPSDWFREKVRARMVYEIERASGGRTEIGAFRFDWNTMTAEVAPFVLRGTEPAGEDPLFRAESVRVGLKIVSMMKRDIDVAFIEVEQPRVNILVDETGITNFPKPKVDRPSSKHPVERLVDLAVARIELRNGFVHYGDQRLPLDVRGKHLTASLVYDFRGPAYTGDLKMSEMTVDAGPALPLQVSLDSRVSLFKNHIQVARAHMGMRESFVDASGTITDFRTPRIDFDVRANGELKEIAKPLKIPLEHTGQVNFTGKLTYSGAEKLRIAGYATGQHLAFRDGRVNLEKISFTSELSLVDKDVALRGVTAHALDGVFHGMVDIRDFKAYKVNGKLTGVSIRSLSRMAGLRESKFAGTMNGPVEVTGTFATGVRDVKAGGRFNVQATQDGVPVQGFVEAAFDQRRGVLQLGKSYLTMPSSRVEFNGTFGERLQVRLESRDLKDLLPALSIASDEPPQMPLELRAGGSAVFEGTVTGPMDAARVAGDVTLTAFRVRDQNVDRLAAKVDATSSGLHVESFALGQDTLRAAGSLDLVLSGWKLQDASVLTGTFQVQNARVARLLADAGQKAPIDGLLHANVEVTGTASAPRATVQLTVDKPVLYGESFDRMRARVNYRGAGVEVIDGVVEANGARVLLAGTYQHPENDWKNGTLQFDVTTSGWTLQRLEVLKKERPGLVGGISVKASGLAAVRNGELHPQRLNGDVDVKGLSVDGRLVGDFNVDARTEGQQLNLALTGNLRGSRVTGKADVKLAGDYPASGELSFTPLTISVLQDVALAAKGRDPLPFDGYVAGKVVFSGPVKQPEMMRGQLELPTLQVFPARKGMTARQIAELALRNAEPVVLEYDGKGVQVRSGHLVGRDTDLTATGHFAFREKSPWNLRVNGSLNVGVLQDFNEDLVSSGSALISASLTGTLQDPRMTGRLELKNASFYLADFPNGLDNANGTITFDERRANIENLRAQTGGGDIVLSGFTGFGRDMVYRLQARADHVRIRYPEGVSTTANASLTLTGTDTSSLLSGTVTILRAGFNPRTDIAGLLQSAPTPVAAPATRNEYLRGMQFDVRVETVPNLQFQTSLTQDLQAEADLRLRGTAAKPVLLGRIVISQGEIQFFGNKYTINRGEIGFFNPVLIEPVIDMDLETRVRGVLVTINFNGPLRRLNVSYRSDPPLQSTEIVALLAVGRAPGSNSSLASGQTVTNQGFASSGNSLLGQAVAAPVSSRLQRFFGVSRLKIDPQLTGLSAVPQARLTIEQQISRDVTLTYVTNLAQANQQIIRLEWDLSRTWSVVAVREENGLFGVDFLFKKRFK